MTTPTDNNTSLPDFDSLWDYGDAAATRKQFESIRARTPDAPASYRLQLLTQIARTHGLEGDFDAAHALLDEVETALAQAQVQSPSVEGVRYLLERGRVHRSGGAADKARPLFEQAFDMGQRVGADYHAIDAAHMVAITVDSTDTRRQWSRRGITIAEASSEPRARHWLGSIYNNLGWDYHGAGELDTALELFEKALTARLEEKEPGPVSIARWCVARGLRSLDRWQEALTIQQQLLAEHEAAGTSDGYVSEELGELFLALGEATQAATHFAEAHRLLSQDSWFVANESERLKRIELLSRTR
ncbi:MAG: tetratricopeptide repeat protein [Gemmatimonadetes bacterium]|nr:tetratricopeptide repeat protein [Gemmatimonadota bacterium]MBT6146445.1 tetratricopeptide repeat protein [Gemmatimonadota bacterium]MBT7859544.1 tetratricopeptide repeat protein [Gemmatimonadota bacterium]